MLKLLDFSLSFNDSALFNSVDLHVKPKETLCLETSVLDGGSSLLKCFAGIYQATSGQVLLDGQPVYELSDREKFTKVSYCYEHGGLISTFSNYNNIAFPLLYNGLMDKRQIHQRVEELADILNLTPMLDKEPHQLNDVQTRLMNLLRGLCVRPKLLLLDEIQAGMSDEMISDTITLIKQQQKEIGFSLIVTTTAGDVTDFCDRRLAIENKQLVG
jgi:ABC-type transporter Mla maintaining outer membrane lipid asymmetry ATPase subunit MlaF